MSSKITQEKYDPLKIERLKHFLESAAEKGKPKFYEVFVDNLKAVDKTSDPYAFDEYLVYMGEDTRMVKVLIYTSTESCPRNDKFLFTVTSPEKEREERRKQELSGLEIEEKIHSVVQQEREKMNTELLKRELEKTQEELEEAEGYIEELERKLEETKNSKAASKENFGEVISIVLEGMLRRNTHLISGIPLVGQGLAGVVEQDNRRLEEAANQTPAVPAHEERNVTIQKMSEGNESSSSKPFLSKEEQQTLAYFSSLQQAFTEAELLQVFEIVSLLSYDKESIASVLELLKEEGEEQTGAEEGTEDLQDKAVGF